MSFNWDISFGLERFQSAFLKRVSIQYGSAGISLVITVSIKRFAVWYVLSYLYMKKQCSVFQRELVRLQLLLASSSSCAVVQEWKYYFRGCTEDGWTSSTLLETEDQWDS